MSYSFLLMLAVVILWAYVPVAVRFAMTGIPPVMTAFLRFVLALGFIVGVSLVRRSFKIPPYREPVLWLAGIAMGLNYSLYNYGLQFTTSSIANVVVQVEAVSLVLFARVFLKERAGIQTVLGGIVILGSVFWLAFENLTGTKLTQNVFGNCVVIVAGLFWSVFALGQKMLSGRYGVLDILVGTFSIAAVVSGMAAIATGQFHIAPNRDSLANILLLGILLTGTTYIALGNAQKKLDATVIAVITASMPVFTTVFAHFIEGDPITTRLIGSLGLVIAGFIIMLLPQRVAEKGSHNGETEGQPVRPRPMFNTLKIPPNKTSKL